MPAYDYDCAACGRRFEVVHGVHAAPPTACPLCGSGPIRKAISAPTIHYKGSGWAKRDRRATASPKAAASSTDGSGSDGSPGDKAPAGDSGSKGEGAASDKATGDKAAVDKGSSSTRPAESTSASATD